MLASLFILTCSSAPLADNADTLARRILQETEIKGGLVVHVGCADGRLTAALRSSDSFLVHGLSKMKADMEKARRHIQAMDLHESVTVDTFDGEHLPYTDSVVNLLVVSEKYNISQEEMLRVLAPRGVAYVRENNSWRKMVKPWPDDIDEWTHYLHSPSNNAVASDTVVGAPRYMQWLGTPRWTRNHHRLCSISSVVTAQGRVFAIADEASPANINLPGKWSILARDAFSGVELWSKPIESWTWHQVRFRSGPPQVTRLLVASGDRLFVPLGLDKPISVLDAATGDTLRTYENTNGGEEMIVVDGVLLVLKGEPVAEHAVEHVAFSERFRAPNRKIVQAVDIESGDTLWEWSHSEANPKPETLASDGERVYFQVGQGVVCLDLKSGEELWTAGNTDEDKLRSKITYGKYTLVVVDGVVLCNVADKLTAFSAENGEKLWECEAGGGFHSPLDVFVIDGLVWQGLHVSDSVAPPAIHDFDQGRDLHTGEVERSNSIMAELQTAGHHHRCYREKATERYIITGKRGIEMMDLHGDNHSRNNWIRGSCQYGILPANGLMYAPPHACGCYMESKLRGFWALSAQKTEFPKVPGNERLEKGPAYGKRIETQSNVGECWSQYRRDPLRSGIAGTTLQTALQPAWRTEIGGRLTPPVIADGTVLFSSVDEDTVYVLNATNGEVVWQYTVGGRIDSPPTVYQGKVLFGSADGYVYCVGLSDGELMWRFLAARADVRTVAENRVESLWPVHGSVLILDGVAYCSAGRSTWLDGGIDLYGLDPTTGRVVYQTHFESRHPEFEESKDKAAPEHITRIDQNTTDYKTFLASDKSDSFSMAAGAVSDVLVSDGRDVFLHHVRFDEKLRRQEKMASHLFSTSSLLDDAENHRSHWVLGTGDFSRVPVAYSWIVNRPGSRTPTIAVPTGVMMVYDNENVWGVRRNGDSNGSYSLFQKVNNTFSSAEKHLPDFRDISKEQATACVWRKDLPARTKGMLKSGDNLFLGVVPVEIPVGDPHAAYMGKMDGKIWVVASSDGSKIRDYPLESTPIWDGMAAAESRLFISMTDGSVCCWEEDS